MPVRFLPDTGFRWVRTKPHAASTESDMWSTTAVNARPCTDVSAPVSK